MNRRLPPRLDFFAKPALAFVALLAFTPLSLAQFVWSSGDLNLLGIPLNVLGVESTLTIQSTADHDYSTRDFVNQGIVNWLAGDIRGGNGSSLTNHAAWNDSATNTLNNDFGGVASVFINAADGTYTKSAGTTTFGIALQNAGTLNTTGGVLSLNVGGTFTDGTLQTGAGELRLSSGTLTASGTSTFSNFHLAGGTLSGTHTLLGAIEWRGGNFNAAGTTTIGSTGVLTISAIVDHDFNTHHLVNDGTVNWTGGRIRSGNGASFTNNAAFNDTANNVVNGDFGGTAWQFVNSASGTYHKLGAGVTTFSVAFVNAGTINTLGGRLSLAAGGTFSNGAKQTGTADLVLTAGTLTGSGDLTFSNFVIEGGTMTGNHTLHGAIDWRDGNFNSGTTTTIASDGVLKITTAADHDFNTHHFVNNGTIEWESGRIRSGNGGSFLNNATFNDNTASFINDEFGGVQWIFTNSSTGTYNKNAAGTSTFLVPLHNQGVLNVNAGTLSLGAGGTFSTGSSQTGPNPLQLTAGTLTINGDSTFSNFVIAGGTVTGTPNLHGAIQWNAGNFNNAATTTIAADGVLTIDSVADHDFNAHHFINNGTIDWKNGRIRSGNAGTFLNYATFVDSATSSINTDFGGTPLVFTNAASGLYQKVAGATSFLAPLHNYGTIEILGDSIALNGGGSFFDGAQQTGSGALVLNAGTFSLSGTSTSTNLVFAGGVIAGAHTLNGTITWQGGTFNNTGTTTIGAGGTLLVTGVADHDFNTHHLINDGTIQWNGGRLRSGNAGTFLNRGTFNDAASRDFNNDYGGTLSTFTNDVTGEYRKLTAGTTTMRVSFINHGTLDIGVGVFQPTVSLSLASTAFTRFGIGGLTPGTESGYLSYASALALAGTLELYFANDAHLALTGAESFTLISGGTLSGTFANVTNGQRLLTADGLGSFQINYGAGSPFAANSLVISAFTPVPEPSTWVLLGLGTVLVAASAMRRTRRDAKSKRP